MKRVGHKGADALAPGNTMESFRAAAEAGIDMVEFDVLPGPDGALVLAHDYADAASREPLTLDEGLDHLAGAEYAGIELDVDLKRPGYERAVADGLRRRGLESRSLVSTTYLESLERLGEVAPELRRGWSVPRAQRDYTRSLAAPVAYTVMRYWRARLPRRAAEAVRLRRCEAVMAHWMLVGPRLAEALRAVGGELYAWTVDDRRRIERLAALGVTGVITNDPNLFTAPVAAPAG